MPGTALLLKTRDQLVDAPTQPLQLTQCILCGLAKLDTVQLKSATPGFRSQIVVRHPIQTLHNQSLPPEDTVPLPLSTRALFLPCGGALALLVTTAAPGRSQAPSDSAAVETTVGRYHQALSQGDSAVALALLSPAAVIVESGRIESLGEYRSHHLPADIAFAQAVKATRSPVSVSVRGDVAWTTATTTARGTYGGRPIDSAAAELMVLIRAPGGWTISAIHWSSR